MAQEVSSTKGAATVDEDKTVGMPLSDFVLQLEDYTPTVSDRQMTVMILNKQLNSKL